MANIQHSGTAFVLRHLLRDVYATGAHVGHMHLKTRDRALIMQNIEAAELSITTMRRGLRDSWHSRGLSMDELRDAFMMFAEIQPLCYVLHIDRPTEAQPVLDKINRKFPELALATDWRVVPSLVSKSP